MTQIYWKRKTFEMFFWISSKCDVWWKHEKKNLKLIFVFFFKYIWIIKYRKSSQFFFNFYLFLFYDYFVIESFFFNDKNLIRKLVIFYFEIACPSRYKFCLFFQNCVVKSGGGNWFFIYVKFFNKCQINWKTLKNSGNCWKIDKF